MDILNNRLTRRKFVASGIAALGTTTFFPVSAETDLQSMTVQDVIDIVIRNVPGAPFAQTVDTLKAGKPGTVVTGIVTTMFATAGVIHEAIRLNANFIIAHEPTFYNHLDDTSAFENDAVYKYKRDLLDKHGIAVWRCHDYIHALRPDGVLTGVLEAIGWQQYYNSQNPNVVTIPAMTLEKLAGLLKEKIGTPHIKVCGALQQSCSRIGLIPGAAGGKRQIQFLMDQQPDVLIVGEISEWETVEYIRDARASGANRALIVLGHAVSEEPGMVWMAGWLAPQVHRLKVDHVAAGEPFTWV